MCLRKRAEDSCNHVLLWCPTVHKLLDYDLWVVRNELSDGRFGEGRAVGMEEHQE